MPPKRKSDTYASKKGLKKPGKPTKVEEIVFDRDARTDYLTGFHKRKLARIKAAKEATAAMDKLAKLDARKQVRRARAPAQMCTDGGRSRCATSARRSSRS